MRGGMDCGVGAGLLLVDCSIYRYSRSKFSSVGFRGWKFAEPRSSLVIVVAVSSWLLGLSTS